MQSCTVQVFSVCAEMRLSRLRCFAVLTMAAAERGYIGQACRLLYLVKVRCAGDIVKDGDIIAQIETDKVTIDVRYTEAKPGKIKEILIGKDDTVSVGQNVAVVEQVTLRSTCTTGHKSEQLRLMSLPVGIMIFCGGPSSGIASCCFSALRLREAWE